MADRYAVFGNPVEHSRSPDIHAMFAAQTGQDMTYEKVLVELEQFDQAAQQFFDRGGKGLNVTVPFKGDAYQFAARLTPRARKAAAVNTLALHDDGTVLGDNTDGVGMVRDITKNLGWEIAGKKVLMLGAGGAVRGVLGPVLAEQPQHVVIANRTVSKALSLAKGFAEEGYILGCALDMLPGQQFDLVINGTSASLAGESIALPDDLMLPGGACYDMMYGGQPTPFLQWAQDRGGAKTSDGLGMLVEQAAESFALWRGVAPNTGAVIQNLRAVIQGR